MKKIKTFFTILSIFGLPLLISTQNVLADLLPPGERRKPNINIYYESYIIKPQYIIIGIIILFIIVISFIALFKIRKNDK